MKLRMERSVAIAAVLALLLLAGVDEAQDYDSQPPGEAMVAEPAGQPTVAPPIGQPMVAPPPGPAMVPQPPRQAMVVQPSPCMTPQVCDNGGCVCPDTCRDCNWHYFAGGIFLSR